MRPLSLVIALLAASALAQSDGPLPRKPFFGAGMQPPTAEQREALRLPATGGFVVMQVLPGTTAEAAGLKVNDVLLSIDGRTIDAPAAVNQTLSQLPTGRPIKIEIVRDGKPLTLSAPLRPRPLDNTSDYETVYDHVVSEGKRIRTFVTRPKSSAGKVPLIFFIQGVGLGSMEQPLNSTGVYSRILKGFNDAGYATMRVEKPGVGDSEGVAQELTYAAEVEALRAAMRSVSKYDFVDQDKILIWGHSMGGCQGPKIAAEFPHVRGLAVFGTVARTWQEYTIENIRRQRGMAGVKPGELDKLARQTIATMHLLFNEGMTPAEAKEKRPEWADAISVMSPDSRTMYGMNFAYWPTCYGQNLGAAWEKVNTDVLVIFGTSEFIASEADHPMIADIVNANHPGRARYVKIDKMDHGFRAAEDPMHSMRTWGQPGGPEFNPEIVRVLTEWADGVLKKDRR
jgi:pimeloyl-ACP methyl ester carboxylesterase